MALDRRHRESRPIEAADGVDVGAGGDQQPLRFHIAADRGKHQGGAAVVGGGVDVSAGGDQAAHEDHVIFLGGENEQRLPVGAARVDVDTGRHQTRRRVQIATLERAQVFLIGYRLRVHGHDRGRQKQRGEPRTRT